MIITEDGRLDAIVVRAIQIGIPEGEEFIHRVQFNDHTEDRLYHRLSFDEIDGIRITKMHVDCDGCEGTLVLTWDTNKDTLNNDGSELHIKEPFLSQGYKICAVAHTHFYTNDQKAVRESPHDSMTAMCRTDQVNVTNIASKRYLKPKVPQRQQAPAPVSNIFQKMLGRLNKG